ncbi:DUF1671-domain-containing protein [Pyrenochaeta sp. DS3sAY3a]|nr:DUF1671-domain-containing protein [Pyrenochaeta sp. DS3sAY3a]
MAGNPALLDCPLCDFTVLPSDVYILRLHFEQVHTTDSPFIVEDDPDVQPPALPPRPSSAQTPVPSSDEDDNTVECPEPDCGETVLLSDYNDHLDYHSAETLSFDETTGKYHSHPSAATMQGLADALYSPKGHTDAPLLDNDSGTDISSAKKKGEGRRRKVRRRTHRERSNTDSSEKSTLARSILSFNPFTKLDKVIKPPSNSARLGKSELGPYAWEDRMPKWLYDQLDAGPKITVVNRIGRDGRLIKQEQVQNETPGIIPILAQLSALDRSVVSAYYCHPSTLHIGKTPKEGGFCGYRNIQMLLSYIQGAKAQGHEEFRGRTPGILVVQDFIETAWDKDINAIGRIQTGGIRGTRKYIGTPEAQAFFLSSEINCAVEMFSDSKSRDTEAHESLLAAIERYFAQAAISDDSNVYKTLLPPIYLQQPGHSLTIVGFERRRDGSCNLMVFDPMYSTSPAMHKLIGRKSIRNARPEVLHAYRRGPRQLRKHAAFEILMLTATPPLFPAWDVLRQFPDCRFVYAFFRSRTLGYDVYPEDYFLTSFPWQQYGGLWVCDEARFARAEPLNPLFVQALRRMTSGENSNQSSNSTSPTSQLTSSSFQCLPSANAHMREELHGQLSNLIPGFSSYGHDVSGASGGPVFNMGGLGATLPQPQAMKPSLSILTDVGRKYPGFPTPLSPTPSAKELFPSPASEVGEGHATPRAFSPALEYGTGAKFDEFKLHEPFHHQPRSHECNSTQIGPADTHQPFTRTPPRPMRPPFSCTTSPVSPTASSRSHSPRRALMKSILNKQVLHDLSYNTALSPPPALHFHPSTVNIPSPTRSLSSTSSFSQYHSTHLPVHTRTFPIANGLETNTTSPLDPSGTMLLYTSNRAVDSGLLGMQPLSESQVAEYRFWRPCGRRVCAFGCGAAHEGEWGAAKRLFRGVEDVDFDVPVGDGEESDGKRQSQCQRGGQGFGYDGASEACSSEEGRFGASIWAGRRLVTDWNRFLGGCEREGVARF